MDDEVKSNASAQWTKLPFNLPAHAKSPNWSPDGQQVTFKLDGQIQLASIYENHPFVCLTCNLEKASRAFFSPLRKSLAITVYEKRFKGKIYIWNDNNKPIEIAEIGYVWNGMTWSPDERSLISIQDTQDQDIHLSLVNTEERKNTNLTKDYLSIGASWSPIGDRIAFVGHPKSDDDNYYYIFTIKPDGSDIQRLVKQEQTPSETIEMLLAWGNIQWSPDGNWIAFPSATTPDNVDIYGVMSDGSKTINISDLPGTDKNPAWSPDGQWLAFTSHENDRDYVYITKPDGQPRIKALETQAGNCTNLAWSPDNSKLVFTCQYNENISIDLAWTDAKKAVTLLDIPITRNLNLAWRPCQKLDP